MSEGLGEWDDELEDTVPELIYPNVAAFVSEKLATSYPPAAQRPGRCDLVPAVVEARGSDQPPRSTVAGLGVPPPGRHHRDERVVARPCRPPHVLTALNRWTVQGLHRGRRPPPQPRPSTLRGTALRAVLNRMLSADAQGDHARCP